jgi:hypothetical protein
MGGKCISGAHERPRGAGTFVHVVDMVFPDVLGPNAILRFTWNLLADFVWMVLIEQKGSLLRCRPVHSLR